MTRAIDPASEIAAEHVVWAAAQGLSPRGLIEATGIRWPRLAEPDWDDAVLALTRAWHLLQSPQPWRIAA